MTDDETAELDRTLRSCDEARGQLAAALDKALAALSGTRKDAADLRARLAAAEALISRQMGDLAPLEEVEKMKHELDEERAKLLLEVNRAMESAESVRREGIEALEEARDFRKKG